QARSRARNSAEHAAACDCRKTLFRALMPGRLPEERCLLLRRGAARAKSFVSLAGGRGEALLLFERGELFVDLAFLLHELEAMLGSIGIELAQGRCARLLLVHLLLDARETGQGAAVVETAERGADLCF